MRTIFVLPFAWAVLGAASDCSSAGPAERPSSSLDAANGEILDVDGNAQKPHHDLDGQRLPRGAISRLGSRRLRHEGWRKRVWLTPDNKTLISSSPDNGICVWIAQTGKFVRKLDLDGMRFATMQPSHDGKSLAVVSSKIDRIKREMRYDLSLWATNTWKARPIASWTSSLGSDLCLAVSADTTTVATGEGRGKVRLWDVASGDELLNYSVGQRGINALAFSPDGVFLAIGADDGVFLWDWLSGDAPKKISAIAAPIRVVTFSPDGSLLVTGGIDRFAAHVWDVASGKQLFRLKGNARGYEPVDLAFTSDGKSLMVPAPGEKTVEIFDITTGRYRESLDAGTIKPRDVAISSNGRLVAAAGPETAIKVWSLPDRKCITDRFIGHDEAAYEVRFTPADQLVVTGCLDGTIRVWDSHTGQHIRSLETGGWISSLAISPRGDRIASCGFDETLRLWDFVSGREIYRLPGHGRTGGNRQFVVAFNHDASNLLSFGPDFYLREWNTKNGKARQELAIRPSGFEVEETEDGTLRLANSPDGPFGEGLAGAFVKAHVNYPANKLYLSDWGQTIRAFDIQSGRETELWKTEDSLTSFNVSPDNSKLITIETRRAPVDPTVRNAQPSRLQYLMKIHRLPSKEKELEIALGGSVSQALVCSSDGKFLATGNSIWSEDKPTRRWISIWDLETGREVARIEGYDKQVHCLAFSMDGMRLASSHSDTTILIWDLGELGIE